MRWNIWNEATRRLAVVVCATGALLAPGCGDDAGGASGDGGGGVGGGGGGAGGGGGGSGGGGAGCLDASAIEALFSLDDPTLCAVALYTTPASASGGSPTWGRHGGPLLVSGLPQGAVEIVRLSPPEGATGELAKSAVTVELGLPDGAFVGAQALDLPFFNWTAISWTNAFPDTKGEVVLLEEGAIAQRYDVNGYFSATAVAGRLLYTGLSTIGDGAAGANALYAADSCGAPGDDPRLLPEGDATCAAPIAVASWGDYSGPVATDQRGNVFAVLFDATAGEQQARGFAADKVARGAAPTEGDALFARAEGLSSLATLATDDGGSGLLVFQPADPETYAPLAPLAQKYVVEGGTVATSGDAARLLTPAKPETSVSLTTDDAGRLWVGVPSTDGGTTFVVVARR